ncbi:MAG: hypothetical protein O7F76_13755 [Planctomycetota bacterium]|nr:hypothetical protein [Planctomycetota bacterium]
MQTLEALTKKIGPWEDEARILKDANVYMFQKYGWNTEADRFTLDLINHVADIPPWRMMERETVFVDGLQERYLLSDELRQSVQSDMRRETMTMAFKHFKDIMPMATEMMTTRSNHQPFTAEQVQRWTRMGRPMVRDAFDVIDRIVKKTELKMNDQQRRILRTDLKAYAKRRVDFERMLTRWEAGEWTAEDWGLHNDPYHKSRLAQNAPRFGGLAHDPVASSRPGAGIHPASADESKWDRYVKWFCEFHECDALQRGKAEAILKDLKKQAVDYLNSRRADIEQAERLRTKSDSEAKRRHYASEIQRLRQPIHDLFDQLCSRLERLLTSEQLAKQGPVKPPATLAPGVATSQANRP